MAVAAAVDLDLEERHEMRKGGNGTGNPWGGAAFLAVAACLMGLLIFVPSDDEDAKKSGKRKGRNANSLEKMGKQDFCFGSLKRWLVIEQCKICSRRNVEVLIF